MTINGRKLVLKQVKSGGNISKGFHVKKQSELYFKSSYRAWGRVIF